MIGALISLVIYMLVLGIVWFVVDLMIRTIPVQEPVARMIRLAMTVIFALIVILLLLGLLGLPTPYTPPRLLP